MPAVDSYAKLLLHCDGADGSTFFNDSAENPKTVTAAGGAQVSTAISKFGGGSCLFDGATSYLSIPDSGDWNLGAGDFSVDFWVRLTSTSGIQTLFSQEVDSTHRMTLTKNSTGGIRLQVINPTTIIDATSSNILTVSAQWYHVEVSRTGGKLYFIVDGAVISSPNVSGTIPDFAAALEIGRGAATSNYLNGRVDEFRWSKGIARHASTFTPETSAYTEPVVDDPGIDGDTVLMLHMDGADAATSFTDSSGSAHAMTANGDAQVDTAQSKFGGASALFDGTGDSISTPNSTDFDFAGDFTLDFWWRPASVAATHRLCRKFVDANNSWELFTSATIVTWRVRSAGSNIINLTWTLGSPAFVANAWYHIMLVRTGDDYILFVNGVNQTIKTSATAIPAFVAPFEVSRADTQAVNGHIDEFRVSNGIARRIADFTPKSSAYVSAAAVSVTSVQPGFGLTAGGDQVRIFGANFSGSPTVTFDGQSATSIVVVNSQVIQCVTPAGSNGAADVAVTVSGDTGTLNAGYLYGPNRPGRRPRHFRFFGHGRRADHSKKFFED